ncbi:ABC transporter substrate-binding protein [Arthrobacter sp. GCM10027362]|uniref:ABC transporter substrate-binding protein n=1 Tax=Arthrobacter sp. GCM10027362 TaxID=3273379 RepID=UPI003636AE6A
MNVNGHEGTARDSPMDQGYEGRAKKRTPVRCAAVGIAAAAAMVLAGCGSGGGNASNGNAAATGDIKIGLSGALTGGDAILGSNQRQGVELAADQINSAGGINGRKISLVVQDEANDPARMAQIAQRFVSQDKVDAIIGGTNDGTALVLAQVAEQAKVPLVIPFANGDNITTDKKWAFQVDVASSSFVKKAVDYLHGQGFDKIGIAYDDNAFGQLDAKLATEDLQDLGVKPVASVSMPNGAQDYTAQIQQLRQAGAEVLFTPMGGTNVAQLRKNMQQVNYSAGIVGPNSLAFESMIDIGRSAVERSVCFYDVIDTSKPEVAEFADDFKKKYDREPNSGFELLGYDAMKIVAAGLKAATGNGSVDKNKARDAIEGLQKYAAVSGKTGSTISYSPEEHRRANPEDLVLRWADGGTFTNAPEDCAKQSTQANK